MNLFDIVITRTGFGKATLTIPAANREEAARAAMDMAGDLPYTEYAADYSCDELPPIEASANDQAKGHPKRKVRVIVEMHGGTIQAIHVDASDLELDVVFTESAKYGSEVEEEFEVQGGDLEGEIIYAHLGSQEGWAAELFEPVFKAAEERDKTSK